jgi:hypothetical protein
LIVEMTQNSSPEDDLRSLSERLRLRKFDDTVCFLCARSLKEYGSSFEHVIPRWVQSRYNLWDQRLTLLNRSSIPYRYLTVPCCDECNRYRLQPIESIIANAVLDGAQAVEDLGRRIPYLWLGKLFYGILYKELFLAFDRSSPDIGAITSPDLLNEYEGLLFLLQETREVVETVDFCPGSIFIFETQIPQLRHLQWDLTDNIDTLFIACRMGGVGLIGVLQDGGAQQGFEDAYSDIKTIPLHPIQFAELCAQISYQSTLATRTPKYVTIEGPPHKTFQLPLGGFSLKPLFEEWDPSMYARYLSLYTGYPFEMIFNPPDNVMTWLRDETGNPRYIDFEQNPFLPVRVK